MASNQRLPGACDSQRVSDRLTDARRHRCGLLRPGQALPLPAGTPALCLRDARGAGVAGVYARAKRSRVGMPAFKGGLHSGRAAGTAAKWLPVVAF